MSKIKADKLRAEKRKLNKKVNALKPKMEEIKEARAAIRAEKAEIRREIHAVKAGLKDSIFSITQMLTECDSDNILTLADDIENYGLSLALYVKDFANAVINDARLK